MTTGQNLRDVKKATIQRFHELWKRNFQINLPDLQKNRGVGALRKKFRDIPGLVIGAGPSLDKNIQLVNKAQESSILFASDAAFKPLVHHGVEPHFVVCLDPQEDIARFFTDVPHKGITLVAPSIVHPRILDLWEGHVVFYHKHAPDIPILTQIQNQVKLGLLTPGGTVLSVTYDLAFQAGCNPILFLGQDLSYSEKITHSRSSETPDASRDNTLSHQKENVVFETDGFGAILPTLKSMSVSKQWFEWAFTSWKRESGVGIFNCSEAGILTEHCTWMPLREALLKFCVRTVNVPWMIKKALR